MSEVAAVTRPSLLQRVRSLMGIGPWSSNPGPPSSPAHRTDEGWIPTSWPINFGQVGYDPIQGGVNSVAYSCIMLYARTIAQLPGNHKRMRDDNGVDTVRTSALARILLKPNNYQTQSHFMTNMVNAMLWEGNAYALAIRNERQEVASVHQLPSRSCRVYYGMPSSENEMLGEVFYSVGGNPLVHFENDPAYRDGTRILVPQRDMLHICGPSRPEDPLKGTSPLEAGSVPLAVSTGAGIHFTRYFQNMSRPSGVLSTDKILTGEQVTELRKRWSEHSMGENIGGVPILTAGLKWEAMSISAQEAQIAESQKMAIADIARLFGVPLAMINDMSQATFSNTEQLIMVWLRQGLGYYINHIELAYDQLFAIERAMEYTELDVDALLRPDFKTRVEGLARGVQSGIYAPNEARQREGLPKVADGDEPRVQQQQVPLDWGGFDVQPTPPQPAGGAPAPAPAEPAPAEEEPAAEERDLDTLFRDVIRRDLQ